MLWLYRWEIFNLCCSLLYPWKPGAVFPQLDFLSLLPEIHNLERISWFDFWAKFFIDICKVFVDLSQSIMSTSKAVSVSRYAIFYCQKRRFIFLRFIIIIQLLFSFPLKFNIRLLILLRYPGIYLQNRHSLTLTPSAGTNVCKLDSTLQWNTIGKNSLMKSSFPGTGGRNIHKFEYISKLVYSKPSHP